MKQRKNEGHFFTGRARAYFAILYTFDITKYALLLYSVKHYIRYNRADIYIYVYKKIIYIFEYMYIYVCVHMCTYIVSVVIYMIFYVYKIKERKKKYIYIHSK